MDVVRLNIYERLRDFKVPTTVLDSIFSDEKDLAVLEDAFNALLMMVSEMTKQPKKSQK
tara:strand:+ start:66 stop:242 length:177 start_codon:yes stop_codon:yes gene_type:complete